MKQIALSTLGLALVGLVGCVVTSVYPFYTAKDLTFDPALLGTWSDPAATNAAKDTWTFELVAPQTYKLVVRGVSETNEFDTHLFIMGGQLFLDCFSRERPAYATPTHLLLRVNRRQPQLEMQLLDYGWLAKLVEANPNVIRHVITPKPAGATEEGGLLTLTADTAVLQKFILKHLQNTNAWAGSIVLKKS